MLKPMLEGDAELSFEVNRYLDSKTNEGLDYNMQLFATRGRVLLLPSMERRSPRLGWDVLRIDTDTDDPRIPTELTEASVAIGAGAPIGGWIVSFTLGVGFAGDEPLNGRGQYWVGSVTTTQFSDDKRDIYQFGVDFDGNRPIFPDAPLPVFIWTRKWNEKVRTSLGFPFLGISWDPASWVTIKFRGIPGVFQTGGFTFHVRDGWDVFLRYRGANFRFFINDFSTDDRRLFYTEQRAEIGITTRPLENLEITLAIGWAFDREYSIGYDVRDTETFASIDTDAFFGLTFTFNF
jgi:hypothetical protein